MKRWLELRMVRFAGGVVAVVLLQAMLLAPSPLSADERVPLRPEDPWPVSTPEAQGMASKPLGDLLAAIRDRGHAIDNVTVVRHGAVILDTYVYPYRKGLKHPVYSVTKSVASNLVGLALDRGAFRDTEQILPEFFPEAREALLADSRKRAMSVAHLLTMTSGFACTDSYTHARSGLHVMRESADWTRHVLALPMADDPGKRFVYCNSASYLLTAIVARTTGLSPLDFARANLFGPLGIRDVAWEASPEGIEGGFSGLWLTPQDMARIGWLMMKQGQWRGQRVLSEAWVARATRGHVDADIHPRYGYQWWVENDGSYMALGAKGQGIFVFPAEDLVVVVTSNLPSGHGRLAYNLVRRFVLAAVRSDDPLPEHPAQQERLARLSGELAAEVPDGWVWKSGAEGRMRGGTFTRTAAPAFTLTPPPGARRKEARGIFQVMRLATLDGVDVSAMVRPAARGMPPERLGPGPLLEVMRKLGSGHTVVENAPVTFPDGSPGYRTRIRWRNGRGLYLRTVAVSALRGDTWVLLLAHPWKDFESFEWMVDTLRFTAPQ